MSFRFKKDEFNQQQYEIKHSKIYSPLINNPDYYNYIRETIDLYPDYLITIFKITELLPEPIRQYILALTCIETFKEKFIIEKYTEAIDSDLKIAEYFALVELSNTEIITSDLPWE